MRPRFYPSGQNGHKQSSSLWGTGPADPGGRCQVHSWAEPQRLRGGCDGNAISGRTGPCGWVLAGPDWSGPAPQPLGAPRGRPILEDRVLGPCWGWRARHAWGRVLSEAPEPPLVAEGTFLPWTTRGRSCCWHLQQGGRWSESCRCLPRLPGEWRGEIPDPAASDAGSLNCRR